MRLVGFILFSVIALASSAPSAFAAENAFGRASLSSATCPVYEGYPDCHPDADCSGPRIRAAVGSTVSW
jgi:hypothetical protein